MASVKDIKAAVALMDVKDNAQWDADGAPLLAVVQKIVGDTKLTADAVDGATDNFRRPAAKADAQPGSGTGGAPAAKSTVAIPAVIPLDPNAVSRDVALAIYEQTKVGLTEITRQIGDAEDERSRMTATIDGLIKQKDILARRFEAYAPKTSFAESVQAIQAQTIRRLAETKETTALANTALRASGQKFFPSTLDASLATRRRTPEQSANLAKFIHQTANARTEARG